jgi:nucleotide-binding universal stress UspA family protein
MSTNTIRRILVAVDMSEPRDAAFDRALLLAHGWNADLYLLHRRAPQPPSRFALTGEEPKVGKDDAERSRVRALIRSAKERGIQVRVVSTDDGSAEGIAAHAQLLMADLVVIARDFGSSGLWRSPRIAASVARSASVPVLIVPSRKAPARAMKPFKKVVVATDFTVASAVALRVASEVVARAGGRGTAVHALPYTPPMAFSGNEAFGVIADLKGQLAQEAARLRDAIPAGARHLMKPRVVAGTAGQSILDVAADVDADLVVMGVSRRHRLGELFFGSTFRKVVRRSLRPILAVPAAAGAYRWLGAPPPVVTDGGLQAA